MMKTEFEKMIGKEISASDYEYVENVYMYYPIDLSKEQCANIWNILGVQIFKDMNSRANKSRYLKDRLAELVSEEKIIRDKIEYLKYEDEEE